MNGDGQKEEEQNIKHCPLLNDSCIGNRCALYAELKQDAAGFQRKFGACSFLAAMLMLSEINMKMQSPQQQLQIPKIMRG